MNSQSVDPRQDAQYPQGQQERSAPLTPAEPSYVREPSRCLEVPELKRNQYFFGKMLGSQDFQDEQTYFREKLKLHNRCLHGFGAVCGLAVVPEVMAEDCDPPGPGVHDGRPAPRTRVRIRCGLAYDGAGNELVVRRDLVVDLLAALPPDEAGQTGGAASPATLWLSLCFCEQPVEPARPVLTDACGALADCVFGKIRDAVRVRVSLAEPAADERCETCCSPGADSCVLLARIDGFVPGQPLAPETIDNGVRRPLSLYLPTRISAVSWSHGAEYSVDEAGSLLEALEIHFTRPLLSSTIRRGVVDVWIVEGGSGRHADIYNRDGTPEAPTSPTTDRLIFRKGTDETLQDGDRVLITVRTGFLLDGCCRPVDGENVGGRVPILKDSRFAREPLGGPLADCLRPPGGLLPWTSGDSSPAGTFESWFFVKKNPSGGMVK